MALSSHVRSERIEHQWSKDSNSTTQKSQCLLQCHVPNQYCVGVAKLQWKDQAELNRLQGMSVVGTCWVFTKVELFNEKCGYINTACRIAIDLRKSPRSAKLESTPFSRAPTPTTSIADVLQLKMLQRFDLMAIPSCVLGRRRSGAGQNPASGDAERKMPPCH